MNLITQEFLKQRQHVPRQQISVVSQYGVADVIHETEVKERILRRI